MRAAKEKKLNRLPESNVNEMDSEPARIPATKTTASVVNRIAGYDFRTRKFQKSPIGTSEKNHFIVLVENQRSPRKRIGENVVQLRRLHWAPELSLYRAYFVPNSRDSNGTQIGQPNDHLKPLPPELGGPQTCGSCRARTAKECCDIAERRGDHIGVDENGRPVIPQGFVMCCDGVKVTCLTNNFEETIPLGGINEKADKILGKCIREHEDYHHAQTEDCPRKCPSLERPGFLPKWPKDKGECLAWKQSFICLKVALGGGDCGNDADCKQIIEFNINTASRIGKGYCKDADIPWDDALPPSR